MGRTEINQQIEQLRHGPPCYSGAEIKAMQQADVNIEARLSEKARTKARALILSFKLQPIAEERNFMVRHISTIYSCQILLRRTHHPGSIAKLQTLIDGACNNLRALMVLTQERTDQELCEASCKHWANVQQNSLFD